jgi:hypothetical protein
MSKIRNILILAAMLTTSQVFAQDFDMDSHACSTIAKACIQKGFVRTPTIGKRFWQDCMKPLILGQTVSGVTVDPLVVKTCRMNKIQELKMELNELQKVS